MRREGRAADFMGHYSTIPVTCKALVLVRHGGDRWKQWKQLRPRSEMVSRANSYSCSQEHSLKAVPPKAAFRNAAARGGEEASDGGQRMRGGKLQDVLFVFAQNLQGKWVMEDRAVVEELVGGSLAGD